MEILVYANLSELDAIGDAWDRLSEQEPRIIPSFAELRPGLEASGSKFRIIVATDNAQVVGIACFVYAIGRKRYAIAERNLFMLPVKYVILVGSCVLGQVDEQTIEKFIKFILSESNFDFIDLGEVIVDSPLYNAVTHLGGGALVNRVLRQNSIRWMIKLPELFDDYCKSLGQQTRKKDVGKFKKFERQPSFEAHVIHQPNQVDKFLLDGEKVSRLTYQWNFGQRLLNDEATRQKFVQLAKIGKLRCYMLYFEGRPCAFACGVLSHRIYQWDTSGYDPQYVKDSPGTALMLWMIRDLIENTNCKIFDFGMGGNYDYKSRFGNTSLNCAWFQIGKWYRPYSVFIIMLEKFLNGAKNLAVWLIGSGNLMKRLKKATRHYREG